MMVSGKSIKELLRSGEKSEGGWLKGFKKGLDAQKWLRKAHMYETANDYRHALQAYLNFLEIKLNKIEKKPELTMEVYLSMVPYYTKVAECYRKIRHITAEDKKQDIEKAGEYYIKAARMYMELEKYPEAYRNLEEAAICYEEVKEYDKTAKCHMDSAEMYLKLGNELLAGSSYERAADFYKKAGDYESASTAYDKSAQLNLKLKNKSGTSSNYRNIANCYTEMKKYDSAIKYYLKSVEMESDMEHYLIVADIYEEIAKSYKELGDHKNAIHYHLKSADLNSGSDDSKAVQSYKNAADLYRMIEDHSTAVNYYLKSAKLSLKLDKYLDAASSYENVAQIYEILGDYEKSSDNYYNYAEYAVMGGDEKGNEGYEKSAKIRMKLIEGDMEKGNYDKAIENYEKAVQCFDKLQEFNVSGDIYYEFAEKFLERDYDKAVKAYVEAAKRYVKANDLKRAADCYVKAKDYSNASVLYKEYADNELRIGNIYDSAKGYVLAAQCYGKLRKLDDSRDYYNKAIHNYLDFIEKSGAIGETKGTNIGNAYEGVAESYMELNDTPNAKNYLEKALDYYPKDEAGKEMVAANALLSKINAELAIKIGNYEEASQLLKESVNLFDQSLKEGWDEEYAKFLEINKEKAGEMLKGIKVKPELSIVMEQPEKAFPPGVIELNGIINNESEQEISDISFLSNVPQKFKVIEEVGAIKKLNPGESRNISIKLDAKSTGRFVFSPLEILYKDKEKNKYMKASNEVSIQIE